MRRNRDISREGYINELQRRGALAETFDAKADLKLLIDEEEIASPFATGMNTDGSAESNVENGVKKPVKKKTIEKKPKVKTPVKKATKEDGK